MLFAFQDYGYHDYLYKRISISPCCALGKRLLRCAAAVPHRLDPPCAYGMFRRATPWRDGPLFSSRDAPSHWNREESVRYIEFVAFHITSVSVAHPYIALAGARRVQPATQAQRERKRHSSQLACGGTFRILVLATAPNSRLFYIPSSPSNIDCKSSVLKYYYYLNLAPFHSLIPTSLPQKLIIKIF